jgi:hypothetical protein
MVGRCGPRSRALDSIVSNWTDWWMVNLKEFRNPVFLLTEMLQSKPLLEERELRRISISIDCDSKKVQTGYLPITILYVCTSRVLFSTLEYRMHIMLTSRHCKLKALSIRMTSFGVNWNWTSVCWSNGIRELLEPVRSGRLPACPAYNTIISMYCLNRFWYSKFLLNMRFSNTYYLMLIHLNIYLK